MRNQRLSSGERSGRRGLRIGLAALAVCPACAGLVLMGTGCRLNAAAMPIGVQPDITRVVIDPVTLRPVAPAEDNRRKRLKALGELEEPSPNLGLDRGLEGRAGIDR